MTQSNCIDNFLSIIRLGIGKVSPNLSMIVDWQAIKALADKQGLTGIVIDGIEMLPDTRRPPKELLSQWIGEVFQSYENRYKLYQRAIAELAGWYNTHGYKMMVLKGYACSLNWPKPEHRPCGDIDIWLFGQQKEADKVLANTNFTNCTDRGSLRSKSIENLSQNLSRIGDLENKVTIDSSHHHHMVFEWEGFMVENHYDFINVHHHRSHRKLEKVFKELGMDDSHSVELRVKSFEPVESGEKRVVRVPVYLPSPNLHALFLLKHAALHFVGTELTFRQILDWAFFVEKHGKDVDWKMLLPIIEEHGMMPFLNILNAICVGELGFDATLFPTVQFHPDMKERVVEEVFASVYDGDKELNIIRRCFNRYRRWKGNAWKQNYAIRKACGVHSGVACGGIC